MGIISVENTDRLYWLGRYSERVYTTLRLFAKSFDAMIDKMENEYEEFCRNLDIPNIYTSSEHFIESYCFDENNPNSIYSNLMRGYDNAIVLREEIGSETLAYFQLAVYSMHKAKGNQAPMIELQKVMDYIVAFWGMADDSMENMDARNIIKAGKRIERVDLCCRLKAPRAALEREVYRLYDRLPKTTMSYSQKKLDEIKELVNAEELDYNRILNNIETILEA